MKRIAIGLVLASVFAVSMPVMAGSECSPKESASCEEASTMVEVDLSAENAIDKAFAKSFLEAQATVEINFVNEKYLEAWKSEMAHAADLIKKSFKHKEDTSRVDEYLVAYENLVQKAFDLEMLNWISDDEASIADRSFGTGATGGAMLAQARLYKQATLNLVESYNANPENTYQFSFTGSGPDLNKLRDQE